MRHYLPPGSADLWPEMSNVEKCETVAQCPGASAQHFQDVLDTFIADILGWDVDKRTAKEGGGVFGKVVAWATCVEEQARGSLHAHFIVWIEGMPATLKELVSLLQSERGRKKVERYVSTCELRSALVPECEVQCKKTACSGSKLEVLPAPESVRCLRKVDRQMPEPELLQCPTCKVKYREGEIVGGWLGPGRGVLPEGPIEVKEGPPIAVDGMESPLPLHLDTVKLIGKRIDFFNRHSHGHSRTCFKHQSGQGGCRFGYPQNWVETCSIELKCENEQLNGSADAGAGLHSADCVELISQVDINAPRGKTALYVNRTNLAVQIGLPSNNDTLVTMSSPGLAYYLVNYMTKSQDDGLLSTQRMLQTIKYKMAKTGPSVDPRKEGISLTVAALLSSTSTQDVSSTMAAWLIGQDHASRALFSHEFGSIFINSADAYLQGKPTSVGIASAGDESVKAVTLAVLAYKFRGAPLEDLSYFEQIMWYDLALAPSTKGRSEKPDDVRRREERQASRMLGAVERGDCGEVIVASLPKVVMLDAKHPDFPKKVLKRRAVARVPVVVGKRIPRKQCVDKEPGTGRAELYCKIAMLLHCPWRTRADIANDSGLYEPVFEWRKIPKFGMTILGHEENEHIMKRLDSRGRQHIGAFAGGRKSSAPDEEYEFDDDDCGGLPLSLEIAAFMPTGKVALPNATASAYVYDGRHDADLICHNRGDVVVSGVSGSVGLSTVTTGVVVPEVTLIPASVEEALAKAEFAKEAGVAAAELTLRPTICEASTHFTLNKLQHLAFVPLACVVLQRAVELLIGSSGESAACLAAVETLTAVTSGGRLRMTLFGQAGSGKSHVINAVLAYAERWGVLDGIKVNAFTGAAAMFLIGGSTWSRTFHTSLCGSNKTNRLGSMLAVYLCITDEISLMSHKLAGCGSLNARLMTGKDKLMGDMSYCFCGDFSQLAITNDKVYYTSADRAKAAGKSKSSGRAAKPTAGGSAHGKTSDKRWASVQMETEGDLLWSSLNASVTLLECKRAECDKLKHVLRAVRTGAFGDRAKQLLVGATCAKIIGAPSLMMCDRNADVHQINYIGAHVWSGDRVVYRLPPVYDNGIGRSAGIEVSPPPGVDRRYYLGAGKSAERDGPLVHLDLCIGDAVSVLAGNSHLDDKGFGQGAAGIFVGVWPDPATIDHELLNVTLPNGVRSVVWHAKKASDVKYCLVKIETLGSTGFRVAGFDAGIFPCGRASDEKIKKHKVLLRVNGLSYRADQFPIRRSNAKTVHKSQGLTAKEGKVVVSIQKRAGCGGMGELYYVALSRASRWSQIVLLSILDESIMASCGENPRVVKEMVEQGKLQSALERQFIN